MSTVYEDIDSIEPIADTLGEQWGNAFLYNVAAGCGLAYDAADMTVDLAAGAIVHSGTGVQVASSSNAFTLVSDPTNPRWTWLCLDSAGAAVVVSGTAAATPSVPELGDRVALALVYVQAGLTIAANATYKLDKRLPNPYGLCGLSTTVTATTSTVAVDLVTISKLGFTDSIPVGVPFKVVWNGRKQATAAQAVGFGIKINSTVVIEAAAGVTGWGSSATQRAENGAMVFNVTPRSTADYTTGAIASGTWRVASSFAIAGTQGFNAQATNPMPNAAVTSITIRAINDTSNNNVETAYVAIYWGVN